MTKKNSAFTLVEMLVVISIIAVIAGLAFPAISGAITRAQLTQTLSNARQVYLSAFQMANDGATNGDANLAWPGEALPPGTSSGGTSTTTVSTLQDYCTLLVQNDYLKAGDLQKVFSAPGANLLVNSTTSSGATSVTITGRPALKIYRVVSGDPSNAIFAASANYTYNSALDASKVPYGDKGFVIIRKGGDASSYRKNQATTQNTGGDMSKFQNAIGVLTIGGNSSTSSSTAPTTESSTLYLSPPSG